jgi:hypothetical protein
MDGGRVHWHVWSPGFSAGRTQPEARLFDFFCVVRNNVTMAGNNESDPTLGIRAVFLAGFLSGNVCGFLYLTFSGHLLESLWLNPLALFGAFLFVGLVGMLVAALSGFSFKLTAAERAKDDWLVPVVVAGIASAVTGLVITYTLVAAVFPTE